ncbi:MAG: Trk system potassium transporter TrkA [Bacteroidales bacterium]|jgi:trk system potassium uptake protein TrkA|nr:Trk system potassium transporter TrkA [Bacteroidales bacterium]
MKILVAGAGEVGTHLAKMLSNEFHDIVIIDPESENLVGINGNIDLMSIVGSASSFEVLQRAKIKKADLFIAVTRSEETNITASIIAKKLGAKKTIARVDNLEYTLPENRTHFKNLGIDTLIYPERIAAREIVTLLGHAHTSEIYNFSGGKLSLYVLKLDKNAPIINRKLKDITLEKNDFEYRVVAISRNNKTIIPRGDDSFLVDDLIYVITNKAGINDVMRYTGKKKLDIKNVMILGGSRIGKRIALSLESRVNIKLIEKDKEKSEKLANELSNTLVINGDGRDVDMLIDEGLPKMDTFIAVTGNSEVNILSCMLAKKMGVKKTIGEIENMDYINLADNMGIDTIINKKLITASRIFKYTIGAEVTSVKCLTGSSAEIFEFIAKSESKIINKALRDISFPKDALVGGVIRNNNSIIAKGNTIIIPNDHVVVFALPSAVKKLEKLFN